MKYKHNLSKIVNEKHVPTSNAYIVIVLTDQWQWIVNWIDDDLFIVNFHYRTCLIYRLCSYKSQSSTNSQWIKASWLETTFIAHLIYTANCIASLYAIWISNERSKLNTIQIANEDPFS